MFRYLFSRQQVRPHPALTLVGFFALSVFSNAVYAVAAGNYYGLQVGRSYLKNSDMVLPDDNGNEVLTRPSNNGFGARLYTGYQFNPYLGLEAGYTYYTPSYYNIPNGKSPQSKIVAVDFVGRAITPSYYGFNAYAKAGVAIVEYTQAGLLAPNTTNPGGPDGTNGFKPRPIIGLGIDYDFSQNWVVDISYSRILAGGNVPQANLLTAGFSYHAVDLYCGQFLC